MACDVLRCPNEGTHRLFTQDNGPLLEWGVCADHKAAIDAGEPWRPSPNAGEHEILMGKDLRVAGEVLLTSFEGISNDMATRAAGAGVTRFKFVDEFGEPFSFLVGHEVAAKMGRYIETYGLGNAPSDMS